MPLVRLGSSAAATAGTQTQLDTGDRTLAARARYDQVESSIRSGARRIVLDERDTPLFERFGERVANDFFRRQESPAGLLLVSTFSVGLLVPPVLALFGAGPDAGFVCAISALGVLPLTFLVTPRFVFSLILEQNKAEIVCVVVLSWTVCILYASVLGFGTIRSVGALAAFDQIFFTCSDGWVKSMRYSQLISTFAVAIYRVLIIFALTWQTLPHLVDNVFEIQVGTSEAAVVVSARQTLISLMYGTLVFYAKGLYNALQNVLHFEMRNRCFSIPLYAFDARASAVEASVQVAR